MFDSFLDELHNSLRARGGQPTEVPAGLEECHSAKGSVIRSCLLYTSPSPRDYAASRMPSSA